MMDVFNHPILGPATILVLSAAGGAVVAWFNRRRQRSDAEAATERQQVEFAAIERRQQAELASVRQLNELAAMKHQGDLERIHMEGELAEARRIEAVRLQADQLRLETAREQQKLADALARTNEESRNSRTAVAAQLVQIAQMGDKIHEATNGARTSLEKVEQDLRNQLKASEVARMHDAEKAAMEFSMFRESVAKDIAAEREKNIALSQQLAASTPPQRTVEKSSGQEGSAQQDGGNLVVVIPEQVIPVESIESIESPAPPLIIQP